MCPRAGLGQEFNQCPRRRRDRLPLLDKIQFFPSETLLGLPSGPRTPVGSHSPQNHRMLGLQCWCVHSLTGLQGRGPAQPPWAGRGPASWSVQSRGRERPQQTTPQGTGDSSGRGQHEVGEGGEGAGLDREGFLGNCKGKGPGREETPWVGGDLACWWNCGRSGAGQGGGRQAVQLGERSGPEGSGPPCGPYTWTDGASSVLGCGEWLPGLKPDRRSGSQRD